MLTRVIKIGFILFCLSAAIAIAHGQNTILTATVVDSDGTVWANAPYTLTLMPNPNNPNLDVYNINGVLLAPGTTVYTGSLDNLGIFTQVIYQTTAISPSGSQWSLNVCPYSSTPTCGSILFPTSTSFLNISSLLNAAIKAPRFQGVYGSYGYADVEAQIQLSPASWYYNTNLQCLRTYNTSTSTWSCATGTSGTVSSVGLSMPSAFSITGSPVTGVGVLTAGWANVGNLGLGYGTLPSSTGVFDTAAGYMAENAATTGYSLTAVGYDALMYDTTGSANNAFGAGTMQYNTSGNYNSAFGTGAMQYNTTGTDNVAIGDEALFNNTTGYDNVALGEYALYSGTTVQASTAVGYRAGYYLVATPGANTAVGAGSLGGGQYAGTSNATGSTAVGNGALSCLTTGANNLSVGSGSGFNTTLGSTLVCTDAANLTQNQDTWLGALAAPPSGTVVSNTTCVGYGCIASGSNQVVLGNGSVTDIYAGSTTGAAATHQANVYDTALSASGFVTNTTAGLLGTVPTISNASLAIQTANTVLGALTNTTPAGLALPSCSGATNALIWTSGTGFGCNTLGGGTTTNALTMNNGGAGAASGATFDGSAAQTLSYNTIGAGGTAAANTWTLLQSFGAGIASTTAGTGALGSTTKWFTGAYLGTGTSYYVYLTPAVPSASRTLTIPALAANDTIATLGLSNTFTGATNAFAAVTATNVTDSALTASRCVHTGTGGLLASTTADCGAGTVTSVGISAPSAYTVSGSPVTGSGTIGLTWASSGNANLPLGYNTLPSNTGINNTAVGFTASYNNTSGGENTAVGSGSLYYVTTGSYNTAVGDATTMSAAVTYNSAFGFDTLGSATGSFDTAVGANSLTYDTGGSNTTVGYNTLAGNSSGQSNVAIGYNAGNASTGNTTGSYNTWIGMAASTSVSSLQNAICIGYACVSSASNQAILGNSSITSTILRGAVLTPEHYGNVIASISAGASTVLGSGGLYAAPTCATGYTCTDLSGLVQLTTGSGTAPSAGGIVFTLNFTMPKNYASICQYQFISGVPPAIPFTMNTTVSTTANSAYTSSTLSSGTGYMLSYLCN